MATRIYEVVCMVTLDEVGDTRCDEVAEAVDYALKSEQAWKRLESSLLQTGDIEVECECTTEPNRDEELSP